MMNPKVIPMYKKQAGCNLVQAVVKAYGPNDSKRTIAKKNAKTSDEE